MTEGVTVALITAVAGMITALFAKINKVGRDAAVARDQTQNNHLDINLRDDLDCKHKETHRVLGIVLSQIKGLQQSDNNQWAAIESLRKDRP